jgi:nicotinamidase-related amidase
MRTAIGHGRSQSHALIVIDMQNDFCAKQASIWNVKKCYGFVTQSVHVISAISATDAQH